MYCYYYYLKWFHNIVFVYLSSSSQFNESKVQFQYIFGIEIEYKSNISSSVVHLMLLHLLCVGLCLYYTFPNSLLILTMNFHYTHFDTTIDMIVLFFLYIVAFEITIMICISVFIPFSIKSIISPFVGRLYAALCMIHL